MKGVEINHIDLIDQVAFDIKSKLSEFNNIKTGITHLSADSGLSERTLYRMLNKENKPTYQSLFKIYRTIFKTSNESLLLDLVPEVVKKEILKRNPNPVKENVTYQQDIETEIYYDKTYAEIYFLAACSPVSSELIQYRYGVNGMMTIEKMLEMKALKMCQDGLYTLGENQANFSAKTLKRIGTSFVEKYSKTVDAQELNNNLIAFYAEGLSDEAYRQWLKVDEKAFNEKVAIARKDGARGNKRAFTFNVTDTLQEK